MIGPVGPTGTEQGTIINLLTRFHEMESGEIELGELFSVSRPTVYRTIKRTTAVHT